MKLQSSRFSSIVGVSFSLLLAAIPCATYAQTTIAPRVHIASPEVYKVIAEGHQQRVMQATLKPGVQGPAFSHPEGTVIYFITDCSLKVTAFGVESNSYPVAGSAQIRSAVASQTRMNVGKSDCKMVLIERE